MDCKFHYYLSKNLQSEAQHYVKTGTRRVLDKTVRLKLEYGIFFKTRPQALKRGPEAMSKIRQLSFKSILVYETKTEIVDRLDSVFRVWEFS